MKKIFTKFLAIASLCITILVIPSCGEKNKATDFDIQKGVNIGNWLSQSRIRGERRLSIFTEEDVQLLVDNGFDHLRLPVDEEQLFNEDMTINSETIGIIHNTIQTCIDKGLKVIFDLHIIRSHHFLDNDSALWKSTEEQDKLVDMWRTIQDQLRQYPATSVAYEILNEAVAPTDEQWSKLMLRVVEMVRETEKDRVIILGSNHQNNVAHLKNIIVPEGDKNIMLSFHFYEPLLITHYQASWTPLRVLNFTSPMQYPGQLIPDELYNSLTDEEKAVIEQYNHTYDKEWMKSVWQEAIDYGKEKGLKLYLGEFGCLKTVSDDVRYNWIQDVVTLCRENGIAYSLWEYNSQFGFANRNVKGELTDPRLMEILTK